MDLKKRKRPSGMSFYIILLAVILISSYFMSRVDSPDQVFLSDIDRQLQEKSIESVKLNGDELEVTLKSETADEAGQSYSKKIHPSMVSDLFAKFEEAYEKGEIESYDYNKPTDFYGVFNFIFIILLVGSMIFFIRFSLKRQGGGDGRSAMNFGRSKARLNDPDEHDVSFDDVAGADEEKAELQEEIGRAHV